VCGHLEPEAVRLLHRRGHLLEHELGLPDVLALGPSVHAARGGQFDHAGEADLAAHRADDGVDAVAGQPPERVVPPVMTIV